MSAKLVVIEDAVISALLSNQELVTAIPGLKSAASLKSATDCAPCRAKQRKRSINYAQVKQTIANLRGDQLNKLKAALGTTKIRVHYKSANGNQITLTV